MNAKNCAENIWRKLEELMIVDNDGLDPRQENTINEICRLVQLTVDEERQKMRRMYSREGEFVRGMPGHPR